MNQVPASLSEYNYDLPDERIAKYPLENRDASRLLVYQNQKITHEAFKNIVNLIPENATLFLNNTKVIAARLYFLKATGAKIEVFLTEPMAPYREIFQALKVKNSCVWKCIIGNLKKWKDDEVLFLEWDNIRLTARIQDRENGLVEFTWEGDDEFLHIIENAGHVPLPPYMNRPDEAADKERYQTVFSELEGAVAAPTAGLHFTKEILHQLKEKGIKEDTLTLHVSAGTFRPIKVDDFKDHEMHNEKIIVHRRNIDHILHATGPIIAVGTTALRTLESTYWFGVKLLQNGQAPFSISKNDPYELPSDVPLKRGLEAVLSRLDHLHADSITGETEIFIFPGYQFSVVNGLVTNFHMPGSTLILLVAAFVGEDWKKIYAEALNENYRFLSYGDTSLLFNPYSKAKPT